MGDTVICTKDCSVIVLWLTEYDLFVVEFDFKTVRNYFTKENDLEIKTQ